MQLVYLQSQDLVAHKLIPRVYIHNRLDVRVNIKPAHPPSQGLVTRKLILRVYINNRPGTRMSIKLVYLQSQAIVVHRPTLRVYISNRPDTKMNTKLVYLQSQAIAAHKLISEVYISSHLNTNIRHINKIRHHFHSPRLMGKPKHQALIRECPVSSPSHPKYQISHQSLQHHKLSEVITTIPWQHLEYNRELILPLSLEPNLVANRE